MYVLFFSALIVCGFLTDQAASKRYLSFIMLFLVLIIGLRSSQVGSDTPTYINWFEKMGDMSLPTVMDQFRKAVKEPLFFSLTWGMGQITSSYILYLLFWALFTCAPIYYVLKNELSTPRDYMVAILCLFSLGFFAFFVAGLRQSAAIALIFLSYTYLKKIDISYNPLSYLKGDALKFALCVFLATCCHNSALLFLGALPLLKMKVRWWYMLVAIVLFFVGSFLKVDFIVGIASYVFEDTYSTYGTVYKSSQTINGFVMQFILFLICYFRYIKLRERNRYNIYLFNLVMAGLVCQSFSGMLYEMSRAAYYFSIFFLILVPRAMKEYPASVRNIMYPSFALLIVIYLFFLASAQLPEYSSFLFES